MQVVLLPGKDRAVRRHHPWIFSGAIARVEGAPGPGDTVAVRDKTGALLGRGAFSPSSQIRVRLWTFDDEPVDDALLRARVDEAVALRKRHVLDDDTDSCRLVFAEGDGLPGLVADLYNDTVVVQCQSAGAERFRDVIVARLLEQSGAVRAYERGDADVRKLEGLDARTGVLAGAPLAGPIRAKESGLTYRVDVEHGHKTGFYLDQRDSRRRVRQLARGRRVLNCFSYTGGFSVSALAGGATHVTSVDSSMPALELAELNVRDNGFAESAHDALKGDCFDVLRGLYDDGERYGLVVLDPPKLAPKAAHLDKASRAYKDLAHRGLKLLEPGGILVTFSCSGAVDAALFRQIATSACLESGRSARILGTLGHGVDHPVGVGFPEGEYLKGLILHAS